MPKVRRWRLRYWLVGREDQTLGQWYSNDCKLCAARKAYTLAKAYAVVKLAPPAAIRFDVSRMNLHGSEPVIVVSSSSVSLELIKRHGHRQPGTGTVRAAKRSGGSVSSSGVDGVPGSGGSGGESDVVSAPGRGRADGERS